jgi:predicted RNase H-like HicB family nuclease
MTLTAVLTPDSEGGYVAHSPETGTTTQGDSVSEALSNLKEATELFLEEFPLEDASILSRRAISSGSFQGWACSGLDPGFALYTSPVSIIFLSS